MVTKRKTNSQESKNYIFVTIMVTLVVAVITLLLVFLLLRGFEPNTEKINIINLTACFSCKDPNIPETGDDESDSSGKTSEGDSSEKTSEEDFTVFDKNITWGLLSDLNIFEDSLYNNRRLIAPHSTNIYEFIVRNNTGGTINYNLTFRECNFSKINMKYRLTHEGEYLAGSETEWVTFDELNQSQRIIKNKKDDVYFLEWKWFDSENDTEIGESDSSDYSLQIILKATQEKNAN
ncbi:hypothetical protein IKG45_01760 [Candidatus Saccharibacteria bacterium]|nr:hypothetical protein [Candidatus Saccharibacteria bacterium]